MKIFFDESGNSGQNLLDDKQPIFVLASHNFSEEETVKILKPIQNYGKEIHFSRLKKYRKLQDQFIESINNSLISTNRIKIVYFHKRFALIANLVDQLVEKSFYERGLDLYKNGLNISYANSYYILCEKVWDKKLSENFLLNFQRMIRELSAESINDFFHSSLLLYKSVNILHKELLEPVLESRNYIHEILDSIRKYSIDLTMPSLTLLSDSWFKETGQQLEILHDDSKQVEFWKNYILYLSKLNGSSKVEVGYDYRKMTFPLSIDSVSTVISHDFPQIQLADLIASSYAYVIKKLEIDKEFNDDFANKILKSRLGELETHPVMPSNKIAPGELKTENDTEINPLDYLAGKALANTEEFNKNFGQRQG